MGEGWVSNEEIRKQQSEIAEGDIPVCSFCREKPDHIGKIVAGPNNIFICRRCIEDACEALKDTGFQLD